MTTSKAGLEARTDQALATIRAMKATSVGPNAVARSAQWAAELAAEFPGQEMVIGRALAAAAWLAADLVAEADPTLPGVVVVSLIGLAGARLVRDAREDAATAAGGEARDGR